MKKFVRIILLFLCYFHWYAKLDAQIAISTAKPWTYWWWMGSAVDSANIKGQLEYFAKTGLGGAHIIPIYGARGFEDKYLPFMSEKWLDMVHFTQNHASSLGLAIDITLGTGWPYGGPMINQNVAAAALEKFEIVFLATDSLRIPLDSLRLKAFPLG
ncbi:MAG: glycosyl hydrolase, partial [Bacteroidota bacterium]